MFIQVIQAKSSRRDEVLALTEEWNASPEEGYGFLGATYGFTDDDEYIAVVRFESKEKAMANSARPETDAMAQRMAALMDGPVEFQDCDDVTTWLEGGSDDAGFVQIIQGRTDEPDRIKAGMTQEDPEEMRRQRPDVIGGTLAFTDDGRFTTTVAFTDEASAREGEKNSEPPEEFTTLSQDVRFYDLRDPRFS